MNSDCPEWLIEILEEINELASVATEKGRNAEMDEIYDLSATALDALRPEQLV